ncbi:MAG: hypothetical protein ACK6DZ_19960, partial [Acidobacteriota bacterium]
LRPGMPFAFPPEYSFAFAGIAKAPALTAGANTIGDGEIFAVTPVYPGRLLLRNCWGLFLGIENEGQLGSLWHADERAVWRFLADPPAAE